MSNNNEQNVQEQVTANEGNIKTEPTKKCKFCQSDIPVKAKICPVCKKKQKKNSIALITASVFVEVIACLLWLVPVAGFIIYSLLSGFAVVLNVISFISSKNSKVIQIINCMISIVLLLTIIVDIIFFIRFVMGFQ